MLASRDESRSNPNGRQENANEQRAAFSGTGTTPLKPKEGLNGPPPKAATRRTYGSRKDEAPMKIISIALFFTSMLLGSTASSKTKPSAKGIVKLATSIASATVCSSVPRVVLQTRVLNGTDHVLEIDRSHISSTIGFVALIDTEQMQFRHEAELSSEDKMGRPSNPLFVKIAPQGFYATEMNVLLPKELFNTTGFYKMNVATTVSTRKHQDLYSSNSFILQMKSCD